MEPINKEYGMKIILFLINIGYFFKILIKGGNVC
jgi:hypothetical protein